METQKPTRSRNRIRKGLINAVVAVGLLGSAAGALAADAKIYSGHACKAAYPAHAKRLSYGTSGAITNNHRQGTYVVCPLVRDTMGKTWEWVHTTFFDQHPTQNGSCSIKIVSRSGATLLTRSISTNGTGNLTPATHTGICGPWESCNEPPAYEDATYAMRCLIPGKSGNKRSQLRQYYLQER